MTPEINTRFITPHPLLQPYVKHYAIRKFDTNGHEFYKPIFAEHEARLTFFIRSKLFNFDAINKSSSTFSHNKNGVSECPFEGIQTLTQGFAVFKAEMYIFTIHLKPTGIFYIFKLPPKYLFNKIYNANDVLPNEIQTLQEQLHETYSLSGIVNLVETFLLKSLTSKSPLSKNEGILKASCFLDSNMFYNIRKLADDCNMTLQTFEVNFHEQTGITPKQYICLKRFNRAVNFKLYNPSRSWTEVAYSCGYYDQAHLIKEFREFTSMSPRKFMITIHPPFENFLENTDEGEDNKGQILILLPGLHIALKSTCQFVKIALAHFCTRLFLPISKASLCSLRFAFMMHVHCMLLYFHNASHLYFFIINIVRR